MDKDKFIKIRLSTAILCFVILVLIIAMIFMYIYYNNQSNVDSNTIESAKIESQNETTNPQTNNIINQTINNKTVNTNSELVQKAYNTIPAIDRMPDDYKNAYQTNKVTIDNMETKYILACAFNKLSLSDKDKNYIYDNDKGWYTFDAELLQQKVKEMYNQNVENNDFNYCNDSGTCTYKDGKYTHSYGGDVISGFISIRKIEKAYIVNDELIIEDRYIGLKYNYDENYENKQCDLITYTNSGEISKKINYNISEKTNEQITSEIINLYSDNMTNYKHTFKKNSNGSYYWYSTEPIK